MSWLQVAHSFHRKNVWVYVQDSDDKVQATSAVETLFATQGLAFSACLGCSAGKILGL